MFRKQSQKIGNSSIGIQVNGNLNAGVSYNDLKQVFCDLFKLNFPKIQEIARKEADSRVNSLIEKIEAEINKEYEAKYISLTCEGQVQAKNIEAFIESANQYFSPLVNIQKADIVYLHCINSNVMSSINMIPKIINDADEFNKKSKQEVINICKQNKYINIESFINYADKCLIGNYSLSAIGRLLGWLYLQEISQVDIKKLF